MTHINSIVTIVHGNCNGKLSFTYIEFLPELDAHFKYEESPSPKTAKCKFDKELDISFRRNINRQNFWIRNKQHELKQVQQKWYGNYYLSNLVTDAITYHSFMTKFGI